MPRIECIPDVWHPFHLAIHSKENDNRPNMEDVLDSERCNVTIGAMAELRDSLEEGSANGGGPMGRSQVYLLLNTQIKQ